VLPWVELALLRQPTLPGEAAAAVFQLLARSSRARLETGQHDALGRPATAVVLEQAGPGFTTWRLLFDPASAQLLAVETRAASRHRLIGRRTLPVGTLVDQDTIVAQGLVASDTARP
jgi:hypothetical protein